MRVARNYAEALLSICPDDGHESVLQLLERLAQTYAEDRNFQHALRNPVYTISDRIGAVHAVITSLAQETSTMLPATDAVQRVLSLLLENGSITILPVIVSEFHRLLDARSETVEVSISTAFPLGNTEQQELVDTLAFHGKKKMVVSWHVDSALLGGVIVKVGDTVLDGSVLSSLNKIERELLNA